MIRAQRFRLTRICGALRVGLAGPASSTGVRGGEALKTPRALRPGREHWHSRVFFFLATVCTGNRAGSSDGYLLYPYLGSR